ncbi:MAG TPA: proline--tRNA ligase [Candidatus Saccharimonadales bacterium]|nr:proline--tRNA ligase [Candidatus Saccharimonadales bacterium]
MAKEIMSKEITPKGEDYSQWYLDVVLKTELADYGPVKGCMIIRPYGYAVWEHMQADMDRRIKETGHVNAYFPLFIPKSFLEKEKEHVEGFSPECAWVTVGGGEELEEPLAIRPTSEAMICSMYAKWVKSWRDLPVLINQWANVVRWEKVTRPFLRTTEFLWQEGHTLHATEAEAEEETLKMLQVYRAFSEEVLAMPVVWGRKSESEKFAGALRTYSIEALMGDGRALQAGTSHNLGQHFATAYGIEFLDKDQQRALPWSTSWGTSTRMIGGLIMTHGDDAGLVLPPRVAPYQVVVVPIPPRKGDWNESVLPKAREVVQTLRAAGVRVHLDDRDTQQPGFKYADWEMRGVPLRLEIGPKDVEKDQCVLVRRDSREKSFVPLASVAEQARGLLTSIQDGLLDRARRFVADNTTRVSTYDEFKRVMADKRGFIVTGWCRAADCEAKIKEETKATVRVIPIEGTPAAGACVRCGQASSSEVYFAQAY